MGEYTASGGVEKTLAVHWNGASWSVVPTPNPTSYDNLHRVFGSSSTDVWAVGTAYGANGIARPLTEHWNGTKWSVVASPSLGDSYIRGGWALSPSDAWFVGEWDGPAPTYTPHQLVYHWNGTSWSSVTSPSSVNYELDGVSGAVGHRRLDRRRDLHELGTADVDRALERLELESRQQPEQDGCRIRRSLCDRHAADGPDMGSGRLQRRNADRAEPAGVVADIGWPGTQPMAVGRSQHRESLVPLRDEPYRTWPGPGVDLRAR